MHKFLLLTLSLIICSPSFAQLADGTFAPDWSASDIDGTTHNLYQYLNQDKAVVLHFMTTNCSDCWNYHQTKSLENFYLGNGPKATNYRAMAFLIESDASTGIDCIEGKKSCQTKTKGNWRTNTTIPILNNNLLKTGFQVSTYPYLYLVCPNKKIYSIGLLNPTDLEEQIQYRCNVPIAPLSYFVSLKRDNKCPGDKTGLISIIPSGGVPPYQYKWSNGEVSSLIANLPAGQYTCTVTDNQSKVLVTQPISITDPSPITINASVTAFRACGDGGSITTSVSGGTPSYLYSWNNGLSSWHLKNVLGGEYQLTITDANGCKGISNKFTVPNLLNVPQVSGDSVKTLTCVKQSVEFSPILNPDINYNYVWFDTDGKIISNDKNITNLTKPGVYIFKAQDKESYCSTSKKFYVKLDETVPNVTLGKYDDLHCNNSEVKLEGTVLNGGTNYSYQWRKITPDSFIVINQFFAVTVNEPGNYALYVVNKQTGCAKTENVLIKKWENPILSLSQTDSILCKGDAKAKLVSQIKNGKSPFFYEWSTGDLGLAQLELMPAGKYTLSITDANLCKSTAQIEINEPSDISVSTIIIKISSSIAKDGAINITPSGGTPPYKFQWVKNDTAIISKNEDIFNLDAGRYFVVITDANGCKWIMDNKIELSQPLKTQELISEEQVLLYPNPAQDFINIIVEAEKYVPNSLEVIDIQGNRLMKKDALNLSQSQIDISELMPGYYTIKLKSEGKVDIIKKLIVF